MSTIQEKVLSSTMGINFRSEKKLKIIPIGGLNEVGQNCTIFEYDKDIVVVDMGAAFPDDTTAGTSMIVPDISYLKNKKANVRGVVLTHGHFDHYGAIPYLYEDLKDFDFYMSNLSAKIITEAIADKVGQSKELKIHTIQDGSRIKLGVFEIEFIHVNHSIPSSNSLAIYTPEGIVYFSGDFKIDFTPINDTPIDLARIAQLGKEGVKLALMESTNSLKAGHSTSEKEVGDVLFNIFSKAEGRIIVASFASLIGRIQQIIDASARLGKRIVIDGRSMNNFTDITKDLEFLRVPAGLVVSPEIANKLPDNKVVIICTGSQGQDMSSLGRMANGTHKFFKLHEGDTCIISSSPIPGNELALIRMSDKLIAKGARVITNQILDVHTSGHGHREEIKTLVSLLKPEYYIPVHGNLLLRDGNKELAVEMGVKRENIFMLENGAVFELEKGRPSVKLDKVKNETVVVDGNDVGDLNDVVMKERNVLGSDGFMVIILIVDLKTKKLVHNPDIISRGFVYLKDKPNLIEDSRAKVRKIFDTHSIDENTEWENGLKKRIRDDMSRFLNKETAKNPLIVAVVKVIK